MTRTPYTPGAPSSEPPGSQRQTQTSIKSLRAGGFSQFNLSFFGGARSRGESGNDSGAFSGLYLSCRLPVSPAAGGTFFLGTFLLVRPLE